MKGDRLGRWLLFAVGWFAAAYFTPREPGWNVNTRLALTYAIVDEHRLTIDSFHDRPGYDTGDKAFKDGHFYSDKVIGNALAGVVPYQIARWMGFSLSSAGKRWVATAFTVSLCFGLLLVVLASLMERQGVTPRHATLLAALGGFGTMLYPYAGLFMPYVPAILFALLAYRWTLPRNTSPGSARERNAGRIPPVNAELQVPEEEAKQAYFASMKEWAPENRPDQFTVVQQAYDRLKDPAKRAKADLLTYNWVPGDFNYSKEERQEASPQALEEKIRDIEGATKGGDEEARKQLVRVLFALSLQNLRRKKGSEAIGNLEAILQVDPTNQRAKSNLNLALMRMGWSYATNNLVAEAIVEWEKSLTMNSDNLAIIHNLAIATESAGDLARAKTYWEETKRGWEKYLEENPDSKYLDCALAELKKHLEDTPGWGSEESESPLRAIPILHFALAGLCMGVSVLFEFLAGLIGLFLALHVIGSQGFNRRGFAALTLFGVCALIGVSPYLLYSWSIFGSLTIPYQFEHSEFFRAAMASGFAGIHFPPDPAILFLVTFHPFRGLFVYAPMLLVGVAGWFAMARLPHGPQRGLLCAGIALGYLLINGGYLHQWWGGWSCGPRLLILSIPFYLLGVAAAWARWPKLRLLVTVLGTAGVAFHGTALAIDPQPPTLMREPVSANEYLMRADLDQWYPTPVWVWNEKGWANGQESLTPLSPLGIPAPWSWLPLMLIAGIPAALWVRRKAPELELGQGHVPRFPRHE